MTTCTCMITGGSGFIGTHLIEYFLKERRYRKITVLDLVPPKISDSNIDYVYCDIRNPIDSQNLATYDDCYHLAALCKEPGYDWDDYFVTNHEGTKNVIRLVDKLRICNLIFTSTMMVFRAGERRNHEESLASPDTAYGMSKLLSEFELKLWLLNSSKNRLRIVRPGVVFGKGESANYTRLYYALKKMRFAYIGRKTTVKGSTYVKDLVRFLDFCRADAHERILYNLVYPEPLTVEKICNTMCEVFGFKGIIPVVPYRLALFYGYFFEILSVLGVKTSIHHRRIQKLYFSTNISAEPALENGFRFDYSLPEALKDWQKDCLPQDIY